MVVLSTAHTELRVSRSVWLRTRHPGPGDFLVCFLATEFVKLTFLISRECSAHCAEAHAAVCSHHYRSRSRQERGRLAYRWNSAHFAVAGLGHTCSHRAGLRRIRGDPDAA